MKARFLALLAECGTFRGAITRLGRTRTSAYVERAADRDFALAWDRALACEYEAMETRLVDRALSIREPEALTAALRPEDLLALWILSRRAPPSIEPAAPAAAPATRGRQARRSGKAPDATPDTPDTSAQSEDARIEALIADVAARVAAAENAGGGKG